MKQYLKLSLLMVLIALFGGAFGQMNTPSFEPYDADQQAFRKEMNRLDSICEASAPKVGAKERADKWYEPAVITYYDLNSNPTVRTSWTYVDANCVETRNVCTEKWESYNLEKEEFVNDRRRIFEYDAKGNWTRCYHEDWVDNAWVGNAIIFCTYDEKNRLTFSTQDVVYEGRWIGNVRWTNKWDDSDRLLDRMFERPTEAGVWVETTHQVFEYDAAGNLLKELMYTRRPDLTWEGATGWTYTYDEKGHRIEAIATNQGNLTGRETYTNDEKGNRLTLINEKREEDTWVKHWSNEFTYNDKNLKITQSYNRFIDNKWVKNTRQSWEYNDNSQYLKWLVDVYENEEWHGDAELIYTYDAGNRLLTLDRKDYIPDAKGMELVYQEMYTYDSEGRKLTETWKTYMGNVFTTAVDYAWTYDENGNCTLFEATRMVEKITTSLYYNNGKAEYPFQYFLQYTVTADYTDIRNQTPATSVTLNKSSLDMKAKEQVQLEATVNPAEATNSEIRWSSSDDKIATVNSEGIVTGVGSGNAIITVITVNGGFTATCNVKVSSVSVNDLNAEHINVFSANDLIVINSSTEIADVCVRDITGRVIYRADNANSIETSSWNAGVYIVNVIDENKATKTSKILVK